MSEIPFITTKYLFRKVKDFLTDIKRTYPNICKALDAPAGHGALTRFMVEDLNLQVTAIDLYSPKWMYPKVPLQKVDMGRALPFKNGEFDLVVCMEGLKHFTDISTSISEMARILSPKGILFLTIPNDLCMQSRIRYLVDGFVDTDWTKPMDPEHINNKEGLYVSSLTSLPYLYYFLEKNNLKLIKTGTCHLRFWSVLIAIPLYPLILISAILKMNISHPLFKEMISLTWLAGRRNIIVCEKIK